MTRSRPNHGFRPASAPGLLLHRHAPLAAKQTLGGRRWLNASSGLPLHERVFPSSNASVSWRRRPSANRKPQTRHPRLKQLPSLLLRSSVLPSCRQNAPELRPQGNHRLLAVLRYLEEILGLASREAAALFQPEERRARERPVRPLRTSVWW